MIRILLNIKDCSPFLQTVSGEVIVEWIDYRNTSPQVRPVFTCEFTSKPNQLGYQNLNGFDSAVFDALKPQIDIMIHSYRCGMTLAPHDFSWVEETKNKQYEIWKSEKEREYEASDEYNLSKPKK